MVDSDGQQFHQYQQYEQSPRTPTHGTQKKPHPGLGTDTNIYFFYSKAMVYFIHSIDPFWQDTIWYNLVGY